jgi:hypothetical protein
MEFYTFILIIVSNGNNINGKQGSNNFNYNYILFY